VIGTKRGHSYATVSPGSSETGTSQTNSAFDITDNFNWATFSSDPNQTDTSDGTLSTFIHDVSRHSGSNHSTSTRATWLCQESVRFKFLSCLRRLDRDSGRGENYLGGLRRAVVFV